MPAVKPAQPDCVKAAYAKLSAEAEALSAEHGTDTETFRALIAARKEALVSDAALNAAGCKVP